MLTQFRGVARGDLAEAIETPELLNDLPSALPLGGEFEADALEPSTFIAGDCWLQGPINERLQQHSSILHIQFAESLAFIISQQSDIVGFDQQSTRTIHALKVLGLGANEPLLCRA